MIAKRENLYGRQESERQHCNGCGLAAAGIDTLEPRFIVWDRSCGLARAGSITLLDTGTSPDSRCCGLRRAGNDYHSLADLIVALTVADWRRGRVRLHWTTRTRIRPVLRIGGGPGSFTLANARPTGASVADGAGGIDYTCDASPDAVPPLRLAAPGSITLWRQHGRTGRSWRIGGGPGSLQFRAQEHDQRPVADWRGPGSIHDSRSQASWRTR